MSHQEMDARFADERERWNKFFKTLPSAHPLSTPLPDEHLVEAVRSKRIAVGCVLDLGCGNGRNAIFLAKNGFQVDANDISETALNIAKKSSAAANVEVQYHLGPFYEIEIQPNKYDMIYDFGCLHHVHPHRRPDYFHLVFTTLKPGGLFVLGCFNEKMGSARSDNEILQDFKMDGGLSFSKERLLQFFDEQYDLLQLRPMKEISDSEEGVGWSHMSVSFWRKKF